jgi:quercetin dioxygenase-like cupin family protein
MNTDNYTYLADLAKEVQIPANGILSRTLHNDERLKVIVFGFDTGQELSAHTAPVPVTIQILKGEARLRLGSDTIEASAGAWVHMPPQLEHGILAKTPLVAVLLLLKQ